MAVGRPATVAQQSRHELSLHGSQVRDAVRSRINGHHHLHRPVVNSSGDSLFNVCQLRFEAHR